MFDNIPSATDHQSRHVASARGDNKDPSAALPDIPTSPRQFSYEARVFYGVSAPRARRLK